MSKLKQGIMRSISGGLDEPAKDSATDKASDAFREAGVPSMGAEIQSSALNPILEKVEEPIHVDQFDQLDAANPESISVSPAPSKRKPVDKPRAVKSGGGKILGGIAVVISLLALLVSVYIGVQQSSGDEGIHQSMMGMTESIFDLNLRNEEITKGFSDTRLSVQNNDGRIATLGQVHSDIQVIRSALNGVQDELIDIRAVLDNQEKVLDEHRSDIDLVSQEVKTLSERPPVRQVVREVRTAPQAKAQPAGTLEGATLASIDMWGSQRYVVLRDDAGAWVPLQAGDTYRGWFLQSASGNEAVFKAGTKTRRMAVE
jgi:archaellum component FlaC